MQTFIEILQDAGAFLLGGAVRLGVFLGILALLALPALLGALAINAVRARRSRALGLRHVSGVQFRPGVAYAPNHTWLHLRGGGAIEIGLDDLAQRLLPSVTAVELSRPGTNLRRGEPIATLHGGGRAIRINAPIPGTVVGVNAAVVRDPGLVKRDGYGRGWLLALKPGDDSFGALPQGEKAESWLHREAMRWNRFLEARLGYAAADGGELSSPAPWLLGEECWRDLVGAFTEPT